MLALLAAATPAAFAAQPSSKLLYIVELADAPVVTYDGGIAGLAATRPAKGSKVDPNSAKVRDYVRYLEGKHDAKVNGVGAAKVYSYKYSFNGFAAELTAAQVARLSADGEVRSIIKNEILKLDTADTSTFLGLNAPGGLWSQLSGQANGSPISGSGPNTGGAGEGIVVGIVDSGIWPENPSFSDRNANGTLVFQQIPGWHGKCTPGEEFPASKCNQKLIGAQWFGAGYGGPAGIKATFPYEFVSARDADGHGSHTASTAAGNFGVPVTVDGVNFGTVSGMAPRARVAAYKACWGEGTDPNGGCPFVDTLAAIDQAVADGVDVINYSISGSTTSVVNATEQAFLNASDAGVFVAASAGNSGPGSSTVAHNSPWIATVAASTHDRGYTSSVSLGDGATYTGPSLGPGVGPAPLINADEAVLAGASTAEALLCYPGTLDPAKVGGKIVVCDRGVIGRTDKSLAVKQAGGMGMILVNPSANSLNADLHSVPTIHLQNTSRDAVRGYANTQGAVATIAAGTRITATAPEMATFSSRGPANAGAGDLLKPDITAPGVDVLAAVSPAGYNGRNYDFLSGTSMSSPHIAGIAALMKDKFPTWSPAMIKSALMTSASTLNNQGAPIRNEGGASLANPFGYGAGHVVPNAATNPGLVYDADTLDYLGYICGIGQTTASFCSSLRIDPSDLNYPSIAIGALAGTQTVKRTVTSVASDTRTYTAVVNAPAGITVEVSPSSFTIAPGGSQDYTVKITRTSAALNAYSFGDITWQSGSVKVRSPLVVRPVAIAAPGSVSSTGGSLSYDVTYGYSGTFTTTPRGLIAPATTAGTVVDDPDNSFAPGGPGTTFFDVVLPAGTTFTRFSLFDDATDGADDLDLYVYLGSSLVGSSGGVTSAEEVNINVSTNGLGAPLTLRVYVHGYDTDGADANFTLYSWLLGNTNAGNMTATPSSAATIGGTGQVTLNFAGLTPGTRYVGSVAYGNGTSTIGTTIVNVNP